MKTLLINGSLHQRGCTYTALHEVEKTLQQHDIETEMLHLGSHSIAGCIACGRQNGINRPDYATRVRTHFIQNR